MKKTVYLDYNATALLRPEARKAMLDVLEHPYNASAVHTLGRDGRHIVDEARRHVASLIGAPANQVIFNSGATEANNTVIRYFQNEYPHERVLISAIEHPSVYELVEKENRIPVTNQGILDLNALEDMLKTKPKTALVSVMLVNNETGVIQTVKEISDLCKRYGSLFHCDAVQAAGRMSINMMESGIDFITLSSHKIGGPQGAGALAFGICGITPSLIHGGGQEKKARAGTENVAGLAGFGAAAKAAQENMKEYTTLSKLRDTLEQKILEHIPDAVIFGENSPRISNTSFFAIPELQSETMLMSFDLQGIAVSNGSACSSGTVKPSHVLDAMNIPDTLSSCALRVSLGWGTKQDDCDYFFDSLIKIKQRVKGK